MKKVMTSICLCISVLISVMCGVVTAYAVSPVDPARESSFTLYYRHGETAYDGLEIRTFRVAEVAADGSYTLCGDFKDHPVSIYGVESQSEWKNISSTLAAYAAADGIEPTCTAVTDSAGCVVFSGILPGMYLTLSVRDESDSETTVFESFLTVLPYPNDNGEHDYDVIAYPKCETYTPKAEEIEYKIVKQWKDNGRSGERPFSVTVDILKDGVLESTHDLTAENNWSYSWIAPDDGSIWQAVERNIPDGYTVTTVKDGNTFMITNTYDHGDMRPPQTGDTTVIWPYALAMALSGGVILILSVWRRRAEG